jgi:hypothetical protein
MSEVALEADSRGHDKSDANDPKPTSMCARVREDDSSHQPRRAAAHSISTNQSADFSDCPSRLVSFDLSQKSYAVAAH